VVLANDYKVAFTVRTGAVSQNVVGRQVVHTGGHKRAGSVTPKSGDAISQLAQAYGSRPPLSNYYNHPPALLPTQRVPKDSNRIVPT
jgi:hypothetical protein